MKLRIFTTFTGIGSPEMALKNLNIDYVNVGMSEVDKYAILAYDAIHNNQEEKIEIPSKEEILKEIEEKHIAYNFSTYKSEVPRNIKELEKLYVAHKRNKNFGDIKLINPKQIPDFDLFTYSFPCKNISIAGTGCGLVEGSDTQSSLVWECKKIIEEKKPKFLLMENVRNLVSSTHKPEFDRWIDTLNSLGYTSFWKILNGSNFGVPQNRNRVIMISFRNDVLDNTFEIPEGFSTNLVIENILESKVENNLIYPNNRYKLDTTTPFEKKQQIIQIGNVDGKTHANSRIYSSNGYAPTLNAMTGGNRQPKVQIFNKNGKEFIVRRLSPLECWRLMGYSDLDFNKAKNIGLLPNSKLYERAGRGIVVPMLEEVFKALFKI